MQNLTITLMQDELDWMNPEANREKFAQSITRMETPTDLIILPEMFTTGFTMQPETVSETLPGPTLYWLQQMAEQTQAAVTGSYVVNNEGSYLNRLLFVYPDGEYRHYDKRHLFRMANEQAHYDAGVERLVVEYKGWRICPLICYDLRFPVWSRNQDSGSRNSYDLLIYIANWPATRKAHWMTLLKARAIENLCFVAGVNRIGKDGNNYEYSGDSAVYDAQGMELIPPQTKTGCFTNQLSYSDLMGYREKFPAQLDADEFQIK